MKHHIVDINGNVHSYSVEEYAQIKSTAYRYASQEYDRITLSKGQEWYVQLGNDVNLIRYKIKELTEKTVTLVNPDYLYTYEYTREFKYLKFIERLK